MLLNRTPSRTTANIPRMVGRRACELRDMGRGDRRTMASAKVEEWLRYLRLVAPFAVDRAVPDTPLRCFRICDARGIVPNPICMRGHRLSTVGETNI